MFKIFKSFNITGAHVALVLILMTLSVILTVQIEKRIIQETVIDKIFYFQLFMEDDSGFTQSALPPDSVKIQLLIYRLKNLEIAAYEHLINDHEFDSKNKTDSDFIKKKLLEIELGKPIEELKKDKEALDK